jgi:chemotaxis protein methyltransferase CheR
VAPILRTYPQLRFWVPCCSTGADVWSLAIVLAEVGLYARSRILATDMNEPVVRLAERGRFPTARPRGVPLDPEEALRRAGGDTLAPWASVDGDAVVVASALRQNIVFARHTILHEDSPNAFHLILAPRALRRFGATARGRVHDQLWRSLVPFGWLAVGSHDRLGRLAAERGYRVVDAEHGVLRRNG